MGKESACNAGNTGDVEFDSWVGKIPWRREWQSTPVFLPEKFLRQRSLAGYGPWGHKESDMSEQLTTQTHMVCIKQILKDFLLNTAI